MRHRHWQLWKLQTPGNNCEKAEDDPRGSVNTPLTPASEEACILSVCLPETHRSLGELSTRLRAAELQINWVVLLVGVDNSPHSRLNQQENMLEPQDGKTLRNLTLQVLDGGQKSV